MIRLIAKDVNDCDNNRMIDDDLKLENVLVNMDRNNRIIDVKAADFGLSQTTWDELIGI